MSTPYNGQPKVLILASSSPRRLKLLALLGMPFWVIPADVGEGNDANEGPAEMAVRLSRLKAHAVAARTRQGPIVAADTLVWLEGQILGKPADPAQAVSMLRCLRGKSHEVYSGLTLIGEDGAEHTALVRTTVRMRDYSDREIAAYVASGDPLDKAGAYAIQHQELSPVADVDGCYANVMGLPVCHLFRLLRAAGLAECGPPVAACNAYNERSCRVADQILRQVDPPTG